MRVKHSIFSLLLGLSLFSLTWPVVQPAHGSCGSVTCFVVIGSQQQVSPKGLLTVNGFYNYTPQGTLLSGTDGVIPAVDLDNRQLILGHHREIRTITQMYTLDLNYGVTDRFGLEIAIPYKKIKHRHFDGLGEEVNGGAGEETRFSDNGFGDILINAKYNLLPTLRSMVVMGFGVYVPSGDHDQTTAGLSGEPGETMEPTAQIGRGQVGLQASFYQTYELISHRLNQFASGSYRHTFRNNFGYQWGDQFDFGVGANLVTVPWLVLTNQFNFRYMARDHFKGSLAQSQTPSNPGEPIVLDPNILNRAVPTTGSTFFAYTPGFQINLGDFIQTALNIKTPLVDNTSLYFYAQVPVYRDFNGNLAQGTSYVFGLTKVFQVLTPS